MKGAKHGYIHSGTVRIYYEILGEGEPLILINGGPGLPHGYLHETRALSPYATLVYFDQRGTGKSDKLDASKYTIEANLEDLENLRKTLKLEKCSIFGHSWGGMLAQCYALKHSDNLSKLILADTFSSIEDCNAVLEKMRASVPESVRAIYEKHEREGLYKDREHYHEEYQKAVEIAYEPVFISVPPPKSLQNMFSKLSYDVYRAMWGEETEFKVTGTLREFNAKPRLNEVSVPTLVIVGASDQTPVEMARETSKLIKNSRLEIFEHSRHLPFIEEKEKFIKVMKEFLTNKA